MTRASSSRHGCHVGAPALDGGPRPRREVVDLVDGEQGGDLLPDELRILRPESPLLTWPNRLGAADWKGWVQERSSYMPSTFDEHYTALLRMNDPGESPNDGAILVTPYGSGTYVYTTLSFFRQLPAGTPGGVRLFVNLLGAGRHVGSAKRSTR